MTIAELIGEAHKNAVSKGWWPKNEVSNIPEKLALIHSEISEALEAYRTEQPNLFIGHNDKPEGFGVELADAVLRIADLCGYLGIDLSHIIDLKMAYNRTRSFRHGGKKA